VTFLYVALASAAGAPWRYVVDQLIQGRFEGAFPLGTFVINISGAFLLGLLTGLVSSHILPELTATIAGTGALGAYTTFSTLTWESLRLLEDGAVWEAAVNVGASVVVGLLVGAAGLALGLALG